MLGCSAATSNDTHDKRQPAAAAEEVAQRELETTSAGLRETLLMRIEQKVLLAKAKKERELW